MIDILGLLKRIEWGHSSTEQICPECTGWAEDHQPECILAAAILQLEAQREGIEQLATRVMDGEIQRRMGNG